MSGSVPHAIAASSTLSVNQRPIQENFDQRSDEDTNLAAQHARNAKASSDLVVTVSEQSQALAEQHRQQDINERKQQAEQLNQQRRLEQQRQERMAQEQLLMEEQQQLERYQLQNRLGMSLDTQA